MGMVIDLSHSSPFTARDVMKLSKAPVIFSHSATRKLCSRSANVPDDIISVLVWKFSIQLFFVNYSLFYRQEMAESS